MGENPAAEAREFSKVQLQETQPGATKSARVN
jgi:hypothetical protein